MIAYLDCFSGISGDMTLGALLHAGLPKETLLSELDKLNLSGYSIDLESGRRGAISGIHVHVVVEGKQPERNLNEILSLIEKSRLSGTVKEKSKHIFELLASAEAEVHGVEPAEVHFHEVGAVDSIVDIVGSVIGLESLGIDRVVASPVNTGKGTVKTTHGVLPVPAPATALLLRDRPTYSDGPGMELTTPTGAALIAGLADKVGDQPLMKVSRIGYGLGKADPPDWPNCLRVLIGEQGPEDKDYCWMIETNVDDMNPELFPFLMDRLFAGGALDVFLTSILMKKGRPAVRISVLSPMGKEEDVIRILFLETTAIGVRRYRVERDKLERRIIQVSTPYGDVPVKLAFLDKEVVNAAPEYDACERLAQEKGIPLKQIYNEALCAARERKHD